MKLPPYRAELGYTYAFGRFAVAEAVTHRPADVRLVLWHSAMPGEDLARLREQVMSAGLTFERDDATVARLRRKATVHCLAQVSKRAEELDPSSDHVVLVNASHPGNVGTAIRSLVAFGFRDLALVTEPRNAPVAERRSAAEPAHEPSGVDPWGAYVVRASVGLRFALRCQSFPSLASYLAQHGRGRQLYLLDADGERELPTVEFVGPFALVFGPEWQDASHTPSWTAGVKVPDESISVKIPIHRQVESLNLATSVSIAAYQARRSDQV